MKVLNYIICSTIIACGFLLLVSGEIVPTLLGIIYIDFHLRMCRFSWYKRMWKKYLRTTLEIERYFGLY